MTIEQRYGTVLRCYDSGDKFVDRYTLMPPRWAHEYRQVHDRRLFQCLGASASPFHPQGFGQHSSGLPGHHLGKRVHWNDLPEDVRKLAMQSYPEYTPDTLEVERYTEGSKGEEDGEDDYYSLKNAFKRSDATFNASNTGTVTQARDTKTGELRNSNVATSTINGTQINLFFMDGDE